MLKVVQYKEVFYQLKKPKKSNKFLNFMKKLDLRNRVFGNTNTNRLKKYNNFFLVLPKFNP